MRRWRLEPKLAADPEPAAWPVTHALYLLAGAFIASVLAAILVLLAGGAEELTSGAVIVAAGVQTVVLGAGTLELMKRQGGRTCCSGTWHEAPWAPW